VRLAESITGRWRGCCKPGKITRRRGRTVNSGRQGVTVIARVLLISFYFPPAGGGGVQRPLKLAAQLPQFGIETEVLAPDDPKWIHRDQQLRLPDGVPVARARYFGPRGRLPAEELYGRRGVDRLLKRLALAPRRFVLPDENAPWALTAVPQAVRLVRRLGIDVVLTTSPPNSINLIGAAVKHATGVRWVADLRDSVIAKPDRDLDRLAVRIKERTQASVARVVAARADAVVAATFKIADEMRSLNSSLRVETIANGSDFDDFDGLVYRPSDRFRITHTGSFFGARSPRPFLRALALSDETVVARFVGDFRAADRAWAAERGLADRLELHPFLPHQRTLELQRDSEALLLLLPDVGERGRDVPSGKLFEYLAAGRPILASVPTDGSAADLIREAQAGIVTRPDDVEGMRAAIAQLVARRQAGTLELSPLDENLRSRIDRLARSAEFAELIHELAPSSGSH
jgi:glycosyltransferase involved in cell wall biosynthesis